MFVVFDETVVGVSDCVRWIEVDEVPRLSACCCLLKVPVLQLGVLQDIACATKKIVIYRIKMSFVSIRNIEFPSQVDAMYAIEGQAS
ncbi:hypothetical protein ASD14_12375 [Lysobacter sp. Root494]|nr:hypothetical protein ASD14_12375 [Lysobacter sp. Root494]